jgi:hypothetical protein
MSQQSDIPTVSLDPNSPSFDTPDAAADAVSKDFGKDQRNESAAVVIQRPDGSYGYSTPAPQKDHDNFALKAALANGHKIAGIVHSHPGTDDNGQVFSQHDLEVAEAMKVPSFVRFLKDDSVRKYVPGTTKTSWLSTPGTRLKARVATGDPIARAPAPAPAGLLAQAAQISQAAPPAKQ